MSLRPRQPTDDRGTPVQLMDPACFVGWPVASDVRLRVLTERLAAAVGRRRRMLVMAVVYSMMVVVTLGALVISRMLPQVPLVVLILGLGIVLGPLVALIVQRLWAADSRISDLVLSEGLCPRCGYNFVGLAAEADGCIACPECGAAWCISRIHRAMPFVGEAQRGAVMMVVHETMEGDRFRGRDDRGQRVPLVHPRLYSLRRTSDPQYNDRARQAWREIRRHGRMLRLVVGGVLIGIGMVGLKIGDMVAPVVFIGLAAWVIWGNFGYRAAAVVAAMKRQGLCPACGCLLDDAPLEEDGLTCCQLCRAAWRLEEPTGHSGDSSGIVIPSGECSSSSISTPR